MDTTRLVLLFSLVLFGAYTEYQSEKTVKKVRVNEKKQMQYRKEIKDEDAAFIRRAMELSHIALADGHGHPFGSVVVKDGKIIGEGWNKTKVLHDPSAHAEVEAIRDASKNIVSNTLAGCTIYTSAQPCPMCLSLIYLTGIEKIYYCIPGETIEAIDAGLGVEYIYKELAKPQIERALPEIPILPEEVEKSVGRYKLHYP
jgi:guanine deaminase